MGWIDFNKFTLMELNGNLEVQQYLQFQAGTAADVIGVVQRSDGDIMALTTANPTSYHKILCIRISSSFVV